MWLENAVKRKAQLSLYGMKRAMEGLFQPDKMRSHKLQGTDDHDHRFA